MLADKIIELRRKNNLSEEELSEIVDVSRLTISKWEKGEKTPNLDQLNILSKKFNITMDDFINEYKDNESEAYQDVSYDAAMTYVNDKKKISKLTSVGVFICVLSVVPLLLLLFMKGRYDLNMSTSVLTTIGLTSLFVLIAVAVVVLMQTNRYNFDFDINQDRHLKLDESVKHRFKMLLEAYRPVYIKKITFAVIIILLSTMPLISVSILTQSGELALLMVIVKLVMIALGVSIIIPVSQHYSVLKDMVKIGEPTSIKSKKEKRTEKIAAFYWPLVVAVYLGWSLWTMAWGTTWILWPVAAVLFIAVIGLVELFDSDK